MTCMARALASSGLTSGIPMATCGRWFSPSRLRDLQTLSERVRQQVEPFLKLGPCPLCKGTRLNQAALSCKVKGYTIADMAARGNQTLATTETTCSFQP